MGLPAKKINFVGGLPWRLVETQGPQRVAQVLRWHRDRVPFEFWRVRCFGSQTGPRRQTWFSRLPLGSKPKKSTSCPLSNFANSKRKLIFQVPSHRCHVSGRNGKPLVWLCLAFCCQRHPQNLGDSKGSHRVQTLIDPTCERRSTSMGCQHTRGGCLLLRKHSAHGPFEPQGSHDACDVSTAKAQ